MRTHWSCLSLFLLTPALAGCIGADENVEPAAAPEIPAPEPGAVLHVAAPRDAAAVAAVPELPAGVPMPAGAARYSGGEAFEPTIGVTDDGTIFLSSFTPRFPDAWTLLMRSGDKGATWEDVTPQLPVGQSFPPQSNDPYVHVDTDTGRVFLSDLQALVCSTLSFSDDGGDSWTMNPVGCGHPFGVHDHQTVFTAKPRMAPTAGYPNVVYYCINRVADSACATSLNGGLTFGPLRPLVYKGLDPERLDYQSLTPGFCGGLHAHGAAAPDGTVYLPKGHCGLPAVAISADDGLTWETVYISDSVAVAGHEVAFAVDEAGNAYAFWISDDRLPYLAASTDGGRSWNEPVMVAPPGVGTASHPTIAAGADGRVAFAYVGTAAAKEYQDMEAEDRWNAYIGVSVDATAAQPVIATVTAHDPADPIARGVCGGTRCFGDEGAALGDFIDIVIDAEGRPWAAFTDVCTESCRDMDGDDNDIGVAFVGTTARGPTLRGRLGALAELPIQLEPW